MLLLLVGTSQIKTRLLLWFKISPWVSGVILNWGPATWCQAVPPACPSCFTIFITKWLLQTGMSLSTRPEENKKVSCANQPGSFAEEVGVLRSSGCWGARQQWFREGKEGHRGQRKRRAAREEPPWHDLQEHLCEESHAPLQSHALFANRSQSSRLSPTPESFFRAVTQMPPANTDTRRPTRADPGKDP